MKSLQQSVIRLFVLLALLFFSFGNGTIVHAAGITVNTSVDENGSGANCSLREAVTAANSNSAYGGCPAGAGDDTITFAGDYTIHLSSVLTISSNLSIDGSGRTMILSGDTDGNNSPDVRVISINPGVTVTLAYLTIQYGSAGPYGNGGGIYNAGTLVISNSQILNNYAGNFGSGIYNDNGSVTIDGSTIANNGPRSGIGQWAGTITATNSTFTGNTGEAGGGAIEAYGGIVHLTHLTVVGNHGGSAGGLYYGGNAANTWIRNSIVTGNTSGNPSYPNCANMFSHGGNLLGATGGGCPKPTPPPTYPADHFSDDPHVGVLRDNGGSTQTMALLGGSPAIGIADSANCPATDQRGFARDASCDAGAFEVQAQSGPVFSVNTNSDANDGFCTESDCSLREAINVSNSMAGVNSIIFDANYTITLSSQLPAVTSDIILTGNGATNTILQSDVSPNTAAYRVLSVGINGKLNLSGLTVQNGRCNGSCEAPVSSGGGINNAGVLLLTDVVISSNRADNGGGIYSIGEVTVVNSVFNENQANAFGGGLYNGTKVLIIANSTFFGNSAASGFGGGLYNSSGAVQPSNSTFSGNGANTGGAIFIQGGTLALKNTILANSTAGGDCYNNPGNSILTNVNSLIQTNASFGHMCGTPALTSNPMLGPLANNGGSSKTMALLAGSPALDAGDSATCTTAPVSNKDQRGVTRPQGAACDIGAYERAAAPTFTDVPYSYWAWQAIEQIYNDGMTGGCSASPLSYCPVNTVTRAQMAIFLLRGIHGSTYTPPAATGTMFADVSAGSFAAAWIEQLAVEGITSGCGGGNFCPNSIVTRSQMAIFLVRAKHGIAFVPPTATGIFPDVPVGSFGANYIEQLVTDGVTSGCGGGLYCPSSLVKRDSMAVFLVKNFSLP